MLMVPIFHVHGEDVEAVDLRGQFRGECRRGHVIALGHLARGAGVVGGDHALDAVLAQEPRALRQDHHMPLGPRDLVQSRTGPGQHS